MRKDIKKKRDMIYMIRIGKVEISRDLFLFFIISALIGIVSAVESTSLANRLYEDLNFTVMQRSFLETPRELPGLLTVVIFGILNGLGDIRIAAFANILGGVGLLFFGLVPNKFSLILIFLVVYSTGQHMYLPLSNSIAMGFASGQNFGKRIGQVQSVGSLSVIAASAVLYLLYRFMDVTYSMVFTAAAVAMILAGILFFTMADRNKPIVSAKRFVLRKEYKMYYILSTINGARKQLTLTFVPWLIIDIYQQPVTTITALFFVVCVVNVFFKPWFGALIDKKGERYALQLEAIVMLMACVGFAFAPRLLSPAAAFSVAGICYIIDKLMESASMARATYVQKCAQDASEVARTLSMGQSMDHIISMLIPLGAGFIWYAGGPSGYIYVFMGGMVISVINYVVASRL